MAVYMIATLRCNMETIIGVRLYDSSVKKTKDIQLGGLVQAIKSQPTKEIVRNMNIDEEDNIVGLNGAIDRYAVIVSKVGVVGRSPAVIIKQHLNGDYTMVNGLGQESRMSELEAMKYQAVEGIANATVVTNNDGTKFIRSIKGEFEKEVPVDTEKLIKRFEMKLVMSNDESISCDGGKFMAQKYDKEFLIIPEGVTVLEDLALASSALLKDVRLPKSLVKMGYRVFGGCPKLKVLKLPYGFKYMDSMALSGSSITELYVSKGTELSMISRAAQKATSIKVIYVKDREDRRALKNLSTIRVLCTNEVW